MKKQKKKKKKRVVAVEDEDEEDDLEEYLIPQEELAGRINCKAGNQFEDDEE